MESLKIEKRFPKVTRVQLDLLVEKYCICENWIKEIKEKWKLDATTGYYYKPGSEHDLIK
jgi:hypothetical protein